jgi:hypothetical protein
MPVLIGFLSVLLHHTQCMSNSRCEMLANRTSVTARPSTNRAAVTNNPLARADGRTPQGRRIRDLYRLWHAAMGCPADATVQATILAAAELMVAAETAHAALLAGTGDVDQVVRLENLSGRAVRKLGLQASAPATPPPSLSAWAQQAAPPRPQEGQGCHEGNESSSLRFAFVMVPLAARLILQNLSTVRAGYHRPCQPYGRCRRTTSSSSSEITRGPI